ncbi:Rieske (2Fe-2S) protein [Nocardioides agariphilus]|uniref:Rieske (2Fe-2S) protein n=1 Tax=Nocardioides agariphilus TaxID=433664 RepID=A0A930YGP3_9ACTN|nr:Rieske (2Fe-2S) protein [Nocardioides agariphilus]
MRVSIGSLDDVPADHCVAVADGAAVAVRVDDGVVAFPNRCLHVGGALAGGRVWDGGLTCPNHFWRYRLSDGSHLGGSGSLPSYPTEVTATGEVYVELPDPQRQLSMRERLLAHAREWERGGRG